MKRSQNPTTREKTLIKSYTKACTSGSLSAQNKIYTELSKEINKSHNK
tara:strand:+ start:1001 stop:1144 length:144 start_codon:yes stop_codon:yes gene_type:complete